MVEEIERGTTQSTEKMMMKTVLRKAVMRKTVMNVMGRGQDKETAIHINYSSKKNQKSYTYGFLLQRKKT